MKLKRTGYLSFRSELRGREKEERSLKEKTILLMALLILMVVAPLLNISEAGTLWTIEIVDTGEDVGADYSLALDSSGYPHISYYGNTSYDLKYARWNGSTWNIETVDSSEYAGSHSSLALDSSGYPHISYWDGWNGNLKYAVGTEIPPTGSIVINSGDVYTSSAEVTLNLTYSATAASVTEIRLSNDGVWDTETWEAPAPSKAWSLNSGNGEKTVYYQIKDSAGLVSSTYYDTIVLDTTDTTPPTGSIVIDEGEVTSSVSVTLTLSASDAESGVSQMRFSNDEVSWSSWDTYATSKVWNLSAEPGLKSVSVQFKNGAGLDSVIYSDSIEFFEALSFNVTVGDTDYVVETCSSSSVSDFSFNQDLRRLRFTVDGTSETSGLCNVSVPAELMSGPFSLYMDDEPLFESVNYTRIFNGTHNLFSVTYTHSSHIIELFSTEVVPDFAGWLFMPFLVLAGMAALALKKKFRK